MIYTFIRHEYWEILNTHKVWSKSKRVNNSSIHCIAYLTGIYRNFRKIFT